MNRFLVLPLLVLNCLPDSFNFFSNCLFLVVRRSIPYQCQKSRDVGVVRGLIGATEIPEGRLRYRAPYTDSSFVFEVIH